MRDTIVLCVYRCVAYRYVLVLSDLEQSMHHC